MSLEALLTSFPQAVLVTGGAGFIGSHFVDKLTAHGKTVTVLDDASNAYQPWLGKRSEDDTIRVIEGSVLDSTAINRAMRGQDIVVHLAANAHIDKGIAQPRLDSDVSVRGTQNVLEAMRSHEVPEMMFASSGAVYGDLGREDCAETAGPLRPLSLYGAGKASAEMLLAAYSSLFGVTTWAYRFGNVLGTRMSRGAIHDFLGRLDTRPDYLTVLGDGAQRKSYFLIEHCIEGMLWVRDRIPLAEGQPYGVFNLGSAGGTSVAEIAQIVLDEVGLPDLPIRYTGGERAFPGDQPVVRLDTSLVSTAGWEPPIDSTQACRTAVQRLIEWRTTVA